jgi:hypothetical protein
MIGIPPGAVKEESKKVVSTGQWEDVGRIRSQTWNLAGFRMWQLSALLITALLWGYTWLQYKDPEAIIMSNQLTDVMSAVTFIVSIGIAALICYDIYTSEVDGVLMFSLFVGVALFLIIFLWEFVPVVVWSLLNTIAWGVVPFKQIVLCGFLPTIFSIISLSIIPDFQIGRFAFWHELVHQPEASSEKTVVDVTQVRLKEMDLEHEREKWERTNNASLIVDEQKQQIEALLKEIDDLKRRPADKTFVPANHGTARATFGSVTMSADDQAALIKFIGGWELRGTARDEWTGNKDEQAAGTHISQPQWEKITKALKNLNILGSDNAPLVTSEQAFEMLKMRPN